VHPEWLLKQKLPPGPREASFWAGRHEDINAFERHLDRSGTKIVKFFLHVSKQEQKRRFLARLDGPGKQWKGWRTPRHGASWRPSRRTRQAEGSPGMDEARACTRAHHQMKTR